MSEISRLQDELSHVKTELYASESLVLTLKERKRKLDLKLEILCSPVISQVLSTCTWLISLGDYIYLSKFSKKHFQLETNIGYLDPPFNSIYNGIKVEEFSICQIIIYKHRCTLEFQAARSFEDILEFIHEYKLQIDGTSALQWSQDTISKIQLLEHVHKSSSD